LKKLKLYAPRLGCFAARQLLQKFCCEQIVDLAALLGVRLEYRSSSGFATDHSKVVMSHYLPGEPAIRLYGDQIFVYQTQLKKRRIDIEFQQLLYHAIACEIGHHLWFLFVKQNAGKILPNRFVQLWTEFESWLSGMILLPPRQPLKMAKSNELVH